jgi:hypothetical protein
MSGHEYGKKGKKGPGKLTTWTELFLQGIYLSEQAIYRIADSCTIALYIASWRLYRRVCSGKYHIYNVYTMYVHVYTMSVHGITSCFNRSCG